MKNPGMTVSGNLLTITADRASPWFVQSPARSSRTGGTSMFPVSRSQDRRKIRCRITERRCKTERTSMPTGTFAERTDQREGTTPRCFADEFRAPRDDRVSDDWPRWPILLMKRPNPDMTYRTRGDHYGDRGQMTTVYLTDDVLRAQARTIPDRRRSPEAGLPGHLAILDDGWVVD
jgi:hypothetical protein